MLEGAEELVNHHIKPGRREKFKEEIIKGKSKAEAARATGLKSANGGWMNDVIEEVTQTYREQVLKALNEQGDIAKKYAEKLLEKLGCSRMILSEDGNREKVDDNTNQIRALIELGDVLGVKAPKEFEFKEIPLTDKEREDRLARIKNRLLIGSEN